MRQSQLDAERPLKHIFFLAFELSKTYLAQRFQSCLTLNCRPSYAFSEYGHRNSAASVPSAPSTSPISEPAVGTSRKSRSVRLGSTT